MKKELDIYGYDAKLATELRALDKCKTPQANKELILEFKDYLHRENLSVPRIIKYVSILKIIAEFFNKEFTKLDKKDIEKFVSYVNSKNYSPWTKQTYKVMLKRFFRWFKDTGDIYPEEVRWVKINISETEKTHPAKGDLLTEDEVHKIIETTWHPRDKALISVLYESGCRIGEIASLQIKNVEVDDLGLNLNVTGKTGPRKVRIIASTQHVMTWLRMHPLREDRNAPLWVNIGNNNRNKHLNYPNIRKMVHEQFQKAGIKKRCNPHLFRHSRATFLAHHLTEFQMNQYFGWKQGSDMPSTYVHLSGRDLDQAMCKVNGINILTRDIEAPKMQAAICPRCQENNSPGSKYCSKCAAILSQAESIQYEQQRQEEQKINQTANKILNILAQNKEALPILRKILKDTETLNDIQV